MMKIGNRRRRQRTYLLDVKVNTPGRWSKRVRLGGAVLATLVFISLAGYGTYRGVKYGINALVYENPRFAIAQIVVDNDGAMTPERVTQLAGVRPGMNLFALDLDAVQSNLEMIPLVQRVEVRRVLPDRLFIRVNERVPVAQLQSPSRELGDSVFYVDRAGTVMKPLKLSDGTVLQPLMPRHMPVLTGATLADMRVGRRVTSEQVYRALELLDKVQQSVVSSLFEVDQIDLSKPRALIVTTRARAVMRFDVEDFPQQLRRLGVILNWAQQRQKAVQMVDLTVNRGVPVTFLN